MNSDSWSWLVKDSVELCWNSRQFGSSHSYSTGHCLNLPLQLDLNLHDLMLKRRRKTGYCSLYSQTLSFQSRPPSHRGDGLMQKSSNEQGEWQEGWSSSNEKIVRYRPWLSQSLPFWNVVQGDQTFFFEPFPSAMILVFYYLPFLILQSCNSALYMDTGQDFPRTSHCHPYANSSPLSYDELP